MGRIQEYLLAVTGAAIICSVVMRLMPKAGTAAAIGKMICGVFLAVTVISPLAKLELQYFDDITTDYRLEASKAVEEGKQQAAAEYQKVIIEKTEAYILDEAQAMGLTVQVTVSLSDTFAPEKITLKGNASPYARKQLEAVIVRDLGIAKENQTWI